MAFTLPGPAGEGWWWEEDVGTWRLMSGPNRRREAGPPPMARDAGARQGALHGEQTRREEGEARASPPAEGQDSGDSRQEDQPQPFPVPDVPWLQRCASQPATRNGRYSVSIRGGSATPADDQL